MDAPENPERRAESTGGTGKRGNCPILGCSRARSLGGMAQQKDDTILEAQRSKLKPPPMFKVMLLNDDYTPMEFVVVVLQKFFGMSRERATQVMLKVHREGIGVCGVYPRDVASTKVQQVAAYSRKHQHPLQCVMEET